VGLFCWQRGLGHVRVCLIRKDLETLFLDEGGEKRLVATSIHSALRIEFGRGQVVPHEVASPHEDAHHVRAVMLERCRRDIAVY
jgi:hypothetical protein